MTNTRGTSNKHKIHQHSPQLHAHAKPQQAIPQIEYSLHTVGFLNSDPTAS